LVADLQSLANCFWLAKKYTVTFFDNF
jgi:hypothetical protein